MSKAPYKVYVIQGRGQRDYADCQAALAHVPAHVETLTFIGDAAEVIERTRDADALIVSASPITREAARNDYRFSSLVLAIVKSDPFQMRTKVIQE